MRKINRNIAKSQDTSFKRHNNRINMLRRSLLKKESPKQKRTPTKSQKSPLSKRSTSYSALPTPSITTSLRRRSTSRKQRESAA